MGRKNAFFDVWEPGHQLSLATPKLSGWGIFHTVPYPRRRAFDFQGLAARNAASKRGGSCLSVWGVALER